MIPAWPAIAETLTAACSGRRLHPVSRAAYHTPCSLNNEDPLRVGGSWSKREIVSKIPFLWRFYLRWKWTAVLVAGLLCAGTALPQASPSDSNAPQDQASSSQTKDSKAGSPTVKLRIQVTNPSDKPISNASVYVRYNESGGFLHHDKLAELDLKTNEDGSVKVPPIPQGKIMIQVVTPGWHTFGKWYEIEKDEELVQIKLEAPHRWY